MAKYANQNTVTVHSSSGGKRAADGAYGIITKKELQAACYVLDDKRNSTPVLLSIVLAMNQDGYPYDFSPAALEKEYGISKKRWREAFKVLKSKGYLRDDGKNHYTFDSYPVQYRNIGFIDREQAQEDGTDIVQPVPVDDENDSDVLSPTGIGTVADVHRVLPPTGIDTAADVHSNITNNTHTLQNNTSDMVSNPEENSFVRSADKDCSLDTQLPIEVKRNNLLDDIRKEFGHLENIETRIMDVEYRVNRNRCDGLNKATRYVIELEKLLHKLQDEELRILNHTRWSYQAAIKRTMPQGTDWGVLGIQYNIQLTLDEFKRQYRENTGHKIPPTWGVWINGWNEELQKPNFLVATWVLPSSVISKQQHILDGIPKEYFESLKKKG